MQASRQSVSSAQRVRASFSFQMYFTFRCDLPWSPLSLPFESPDRLINFFPRPIELASVYLPDRWRPRIAGRDCKS